jgi:hypothetical protein
VASILRCVTSRFHSWSRYEIVWPAAWEIEADGAIVEIPVTEDTELGRISEGGGG